MAINISQIRIHNQQLVNPESTTVKKAVLRMGALQAQDYNMAKLAVGLRVRNSTDKMVEDAFNSGNILRTHLLRPTWHFVSSDDIYWMLELTAPQLRSIQKGRDKRLGISTEDFRLSNKILERLLSGGNSLTIDEIKTQFIQNKINVDGYKAAHFMMHAELIGLICSGEIKNGKRTYAILEERVPIKKKISIEEGLVKLVKAYFTTRSPATIYDFTWWSGLPQRHIKTSLEILKQYFHSEKINSQQYWLNENTSITSSKKSVFMLPAFDEFIISYKDRSAVLHPGFHKTTISSNGVFRPVIIFDGKVIGLWKAVRKKNRTEIETKLFSEQAASVNKLIEKAAEKVIQFKES